MIRSDASSIGDAVAERTLPPTAADALSHPTAMTDQAVDVTEATRRGAPERRLVNRGPTVASPSRIRAGSDRSGAP